MTLGQTLLRWTGQAKQARRAKPNPIRTTDLPPVLRAIEEAGVATTIQIAPPYGLDEEEADP